MNILEIVDLFRKVNKWMILTDSSVFFDFHVCQFCHRVFKVCNFQDLAKIHGYAMITLKIFLSTFKQRKKSYYQL